MSAEPCVLFLVMKHLRLHINLSIFVLLTAALLSSWQWSAVVPKAGGSPGARAAACAQFLGFSRFSAQPAAAQPAAAEEEAEASPINMKGVQLAGRPMYLDMQAKLHPEYTSSARPTA